MLGYEPVGSINDNSRGARAMNRAYPSVLESELRANFWNFSIQRATLQPSATVPAFGKAFYYPLPPDFLDLAMPDQITTYNFGQIPGVPNIPASDNDYSIENMGNGTLAIASNIAGPQYIRYVSANTPESIFDPCFSECLSASLAVQTSEELTQSNSKKADAEAAYDNSLRRAKQRNAYEMKPTFAPVDRYLTVRL